MAASQTPTDFPIPPDVEGFWAWEKGHFPRPLTPLTHDTVLRGIEEGFSKAMEDWACLFGVGCRAINYYGFLTLQPFDLGNETTEDRIARYQKTLSEVLPRMGELWEQEYLPAMLPGLEKGRATDYASLSDQGLFSALDKPSSMPLSTVSWGEHYSILRTGGDPYLQWTSACRAQRPGKRSRYTWHTSGPASYWPVPSTTRPRSASASRG